MCYRVKSLCGCSRWRYVRYKYKVIVQKYEASCYFFVKPCGLSFSRFVTIHSHHRQSTVTITERCTTCYDNSGTCNAIASLR